VRLFLDAHISGKNVGAPLRARGHEVRAVDDERELDSSADEWLLALANEEERVLITFDVKDFPRIVREWAEAGRTHAGCAVIVGVDHGEFGAIIKIVTRAMSDRPRQDDWRDLLMFLPRKP
jgi:nucleoside-diphosphate-sugar epimerase